MATLLRSASAVLLALLVLTGCGTAPVSEAATAFGPAASIGRQLGQQAATAARRAATRVSHDTVRLSFRSSPTVVVRSNLEILTAEVNARASRLVRRHVDDLDHDRAVLVLKTACLLKFTGDLYRETDDNKRIYMAMQEFGGNPMLFARSIELGRDMHKATTTSDMLEVAAVGAACEAAGFR